VRFPGLPSHGAATGFLTKKPTYLPGFWSQFLQGEFKLCFWTQQVETDRFFTAGSAAAKQRASPCCDAPITGASQHHS
jgi:hypothetical protein